MSLFPLPKRDEPRPGLLQAVLAQADPLLRRAPTGHGPESYILLISPSGASIQAQDEAGFFYARQSLKQLLRQAGGSPLACRRIEDWPDFPVRGLSLDVSRCRVPRMDWLLGFIDELAGLKINHLQLYTEHTFEFTGHPLIGKGCSPLTGADIRQIDAWCRERHIELCPSFASFGHFHDILTLDPYKHLAEDLGEGIYTKKDIQPMAHLKKGWTLVPGREDSYQFLGSLFSELLPNFSSPRFNPCCDEPFDLGWGQSQKAVEELGMAGVFSRHIRRVRSLSEQSGKRPTMLWSDVLHTHPEISRMIPPDTIILDWQYNHDSDFGRIGNFSAAGLEAWACPSTNSWGTLFPRLGMGRANIDGFVECAAAKGARGVLNTIWGDHGHFNMPEGEWHGIARAAEKSWNVGAPSEGYGARFAEDFLGIRDKRAFAAAMEALGDIATALHHGGLGSFWTDVLFAPAGSPLFQGTARMLYHGEDGRVVAEGGPIEDAWVRRQIGRLPSIKAALLEGFSKGDRLLLAPAWEYSIDAIALAGEKWLLKGDGPGLKKKTAGLKARFEALWRSVSRESEIAVTLRRFDACIQAAGG